MLDLIILLLNEMIERQFKFLLKKIDNDRFILINKWYIYNN